MLGGGTNLRIDFVLGGGMNMHYKAKVTPRLLAGIVTFASKHDVRYYLNYLNGVCIEHHPAGGIVMVATNGHYMGIVHDEDGWLDKREKQLIIPTPSTRDLAVMRKPLGRFLEGPKWVWFSDCAGVITSGEGIPAPFSDEAIQSFKSKQIEAKYPDWRKMVNCEGAEPAASMPAINPSYVGMFHDAGRIMTQLWKSYANGVTLFPQTKGGSEALCLVRISGEMRDKFLGAIMPMRDDNPPHARPAFFEQCIAAAGVDV